jgi:hypothetical protein
MKPDKEPWPPNASVGISLFPQDGGNLAALLAHANAALFYAKNSGRSRFAFAEASEVIILAIEPMRWWPEFDLGVTEIDTQHHQLNEALNELGRGLRNGASVAVLRQKLETMIEQLAIHFETEEHYMDGHPRPQNAEHKLAHARLF